MQKKIKVAVIGGSGQMGSIHIKNLQECGAEVVNIDTKTKYPNVENYSEDSMTQVVKNGFELAILAVPDDVSISMTRAAIDAGFKKILVEKPGTTNSSDFYKLKSYAQKRDCQLSINYQRKMSVKIQNLINNIQKNIQEGFTLDLVNIYSCDSKQPPQASEQPFNQACHDYALLLNFFEAGGDLKPTSMTARGLEWEANRNKDTQHFVSNGYASNKQGQYCIWEVKVGRSSSQGTFTEIYLKMTKFNKQENMYTPIDIKFRNPEEEGDCHWSEVWADAFKTTAASFLGLNDQQITSVTFGYEVFRLAELALQSYKINKTINNIQMTLQNEKKLWVSCCSNAQINHDGLVFPVSELQSAQIAGALDLFSKKPLNFLNKYPTHPTLLIKNLNDLKETFDQNWPLFFYYPSIPNPNRDVISVQLLKHFTNSVILIEKPSHNNSKDAIAFKQILEKEGLTKRLAIGMHPALNPVRQLFLNEVERKKDQVERVYLCFNYPKDPSNPKDMRIYNKETGGALLDLGIYCIQMLKQIGDVVGFDANIIQEKDVKIRWTKDNVDVEVEANLIINNIKVTIETKVNPGSMHREEAAVFFKDGGRVTMNNAFHQHDSIGVFVDHPDGVTTKVEGSDDSKTSYAYQLEYMHDLQLGRDPLWSHTIEGQIWILEYVQMIKTVGMD